MAIDKDKIEERPAEPSASRRRLLKGAAAAPLVMSVASRPVLGGNLQCTASGLGSATHLSHHPDAFDVCIFGCSPGFWKGNLNKSFGDRWPSNCPPNASFKSVFGGDGEHWADDCLADKTLGQVVLRYDHKMNRMSRLNIEDAKAVLGFHAVAALLNASIAPWGYRTQSGVDVLSPGITPSMVIEKFRQVYAKGTKVSRQSDREYKQQLLALKNEFDIYDRSGVVCPLTNNGSVDATWQWKS